MIGFDPSDEQQLIVETVHHFAADEIRPLARECDEAAKLPESVLARAHELGLVANALPESCGGGEERSAVTGALVAEELAWGDLAIALAILSPGLVALPVAEFGSETQRDTVLPRFTSAHYTPASLALLEPGLAADPFHPQATAQRDGESYVLAGRKCLVPWQDGLGALLVFANEEGTPQGFLVPVDAAELSVEPSSLMGIRALPTAELALDGVRVPAENRLGGASGSDLRRILTEGRVALAACGVGVARAAFEVARDYAKEREVFGVKVAQKQAIAFKLADMAIEIDAARLLTWEAAWKLDQGEDALKAATLAYQQVRRVALEAADGAVQVFGGHGYIRDYLPEMHLRNARGFASFEALALV